MLSLEERNCIPESAESLNVRELRSSIIRAVHSVRDWLQEEPKPQRVLRLPPDDWTCTYSQLVLNGEYLLKCSFLEQRIRIKCTNLTDHDDSLLFVRDTAEYIFDAVQEKPSFCHYELTRTSLAVAYAYMTFGWRKMFGSSFTQLILTDSTRSVVAVVELNFQENRVSTSSLFSFQGQITSAPGLSISDMKMRGTILSLSVGQELLAIDTGEQKICVVRAAPNVRRLLPCILQP